MEKKETKKTTKKEVKNEINKVEVTNVIDYTSVLNKIFYALVAIAVALLLVFTAIMVKGTGSTTSSETNEEESLEYDVSKFDTLSTTDAISEVKKGDLEIVYIGRASCGYCAKFLPVLRQAQDDYGYKTIYIDLEKMTSDDQKNLLTMDNEEGYITENFGYTPMILIFKDSKLVNGWVGYAEYSSFAAFLEENGLKK